MYSNKLYSARKLTLCHILLVVEVLGKYRFDNLKYNISNLSLIFTPNFVNETILLRYTLLDELDIFICLGFICNNFS